MPRLTGTEAITYAALTAQQLDSYTPPVANARDDLTVAEAETVTRDGGFVWTDTDRQADAEIAGLDVAVIEQRLAIAGYPRDRKAVEDMLAAARDRSQVAGGASDT